jgi:hypothetical protein
MFEGFQPDFRYNRMMNSNDLEDALQAYRRTELPPAHANLNQNVWREIRLRQAAPSPWMGFDRFLAWFRAGGSSLTGATLALAMLTGVGLTLAAGQPTHQQQVRQALGLNVFSHQAYPLTRLAENP